MDFLLSIGRDYFATDVDGKNSRGIQILVLVSKPYIVSLNVSPSDFFGNNNYFGILIENGAMGSYYYFGHYNSPDSFNHHTTAVYEALINLETWGSNMEGNHLGHILGVESGAIYPLLPKSEDYVYEANRNVVSGQGELQTAPNSTRLWRFLPTRKFKLKSSIITF